MFARKGSKGVPGKNRMRLSNGLLSYEIVLQAALKAQCHPFVCTDDDEIMDYAIQHKIPCIERPPELTGDDASLEDVIHYTYQRVLKEYEYSVILMANAPFVSAALVNQSIAQLNANPDLDSVVTVGRFPMFAPQRARKIVDGRLEPIVVDLVRDASCDRTSHTNCYFANGALTTVRSKCLADMQSNTPPFRWMGQRIGHIEQPAGVGDLDELWQVPVTNWWLNTHSSGGEA